jgi:hypothetical protein
VGVGGGGSVGAGALGNQRVAVGTILLGVGVEGTLALSGSGVRVARGSGAAPEQALSHRQAASNAKFMCPNMDMETMVWLRRSMVFLHRMREARINCTGP